MADTTVKYFSSAMSGAPALANTAGNLISVLDACLVNGFGSVTLDSLVIAGNVATGAISTGHNLTMIGTYAGPVITIAGATPSGLNGEWRLASIPTANTFTFATSGITDQTATGTITAKRAPAGFSKAFSDTNKAVYRSDNVAGTRLYCRIDDSTTTYARIRGYETMSDVDTGTGPFPTEEQLSGGGYVFKSSTGTRAWTLFSDGRMVYFFCDAGGSSQYIGGFAFGDVDSYASIDAYHSLLMYSSSSSGWTRFYLLSGSSNSVLARSYTQSDGAIFSARYSHGKSTTMGYSYQAYPAPVDNKLHLWPVECWESTTLARGMMPGFWNPLHNSSLSQGQTVEDIPQLPSRTLIAQVFYNTFQQAMLDVTGPWR